MDVIKFKLSSNEWYRVITIINGTKINQLVYKAERKEGIYEHKHYGDGIYPGWLYYALVAEPYVPHTKAMMPKWYVDDKCGNKADAECVAVLGCICGDDGCSQYLVRITETENSIIWDDYFALKHNRPNYFHFEFGKKQYFKEVEKLVDLTLRTGFWEGLPEKILNDITINGEQIDSSVFEEQFLEQKGHLKFY